MQEGSLAYQAMHQAPRPTWALYGLKQWSRVWHMVSGYWSSAAQWFTVYSATLFEGAELTESGNRSAAH
jgi:hypothetical protein